MGTDITDQEEEWRRLVLRSSHECASCASSICYTDSVYLLAVVTPQLTAEGELVFPPIESSDGDFMYEPRFIEDDCWVEALEELKEEQEDNPPLQEPRAILDCWVCDSGICLGELMGLATFGEIHASKRTPDGPSISTFVSMDTHPDPICIACLKRLNDDYMNLWNSVEQGAECDEGTHARCWRYGCAGKHACLLGCVK